MAGANSDGIQWHTVKCNHQEFTVPVRYQDPHFLGQGGFGVVIRMTDTITNKPVAIKKMLQPFREPERAKRTYRELKLLMHLKRHDVPVVQLLDVFTPTQTIDEFQTLYFVLSYVDFDLHRVIRSKTSFAEDHIKQILYSLLRGLKFIHSAAIIHRDLKPSNIGIDTEGNVIILDFGLARVLSSGIQTGYVATRWWRAPEVFLNWERYDGKLDMWSVGCVMAELILRRPLCRGTDYVDQMNKIFDITGTPDAATLDAICTPDVAIYLKSIPAQPAKNFNELFGFQYVEGREEPISGVSPEGVDLLKQLLSFDHRLRPTAEQALAHPYLAEYHDITDEPSMEPVTDEHQDATYSVAQWKYLLSMVGITIGVRSTHYHLAVGEKLRDVDFNERDYCSELKQQNYGRHERIYKLEFQRSVPC